MTREHVCTWTCELCGVTETYTGLHPPREMPIGWQTMVVTRRGAGAQGYHDLPEYEGEVCDDCWKRVKEAFAKLALGDRNRLVQIITKEGDHT